MFSAQNKTVSRILVVSIFKTQGKALFPHILVSFSKLNYITIYFFSNEVALVTFFSPQMTFSRNSADSAFLFWLYSFRSSIKSRKF